MTEPETDSDGGQAADRRTPVRRAGADRLRYIPPVAALGTAAVLQVILITDTVGTALSDRTAGQSPDWPWYLSALLLGLAVASCVEGGAAYLMDLYDKHLLARDSVWLLRLGMVVYVAVSGLAVHWWAGQRDLPEVLAWLLAGMSASALFLWSRGSRWHQRDQMRAAGQLDPALPRLALQSKVMHPIRWLVTLWLISWEPVDTVAEARARWQHRRDVRSGKVARTEEHVQWMVAAAEAELHTLRTSARRELDELRDAARVSAAGVLSAARTDADQIRAEVSAEMDAATRTRAEADSLLSAATVAASDEVVKPFRPVSVRRGGQARRSASADIDVQTLADTLSTHFGTEYVGKPTAIAYLRQVYGSCSADRAMEAKDIHNVGRDRSGTDTGADSDDEQETPTVGGTSVEVSG